MNKKYTIERPIGRGSFSTVYLGILNNKKVAIKVFNKSVENSCIDEELNILEKVKNCNNVVKMIDLLYIESRPSPVFEIMGCCLGVTLLDLINSKRISIFLIKKILKDIVQGLVYLKTNKIVHGDIKPENILFDENFTAKITDFGNARICYSKTRGYIQSRPYRAPECLLELNFDMSADIWSLGCLVYEIITGKVLFFNRTFKYRKTEIVFHLSQMEKICGRFSKCYFEFNEIKKTFDFNKEDLRRLNSFFNNNGSIKNFFKIENLDFKLIEQYLPFEYQQIISFINQMLVLNPKLRSEPKALLLHPWLLS